MASDTPSGPDPTLYLYTSLTAGSSHIITATSRLETILKANKIAFRAIDCATDEKARSLWSRRSKGRKIPGLVKYGQVIGDLEEVEEWNEYGEIKDNIDNVSDLFGDTPMTDTPMPPPAPITLKDPLAKPAGSSETSSVSSSQAKHISISDPKDGSVSPASTTKSQKDETPFSVAMRQAGVEAAAKAGQMKANAASSLKSSSTSSAIPAKRDSTDTTPTASAMKMSIEATEPGDATEITAAKMPEQLAAEGAKKTSVDKIAEHVDGGKLSAPTIEADHSKSTEEQVLEARRGSSISKVPSRLAEETSVDDLTASGKEETVTSEANLTTLDSQGSGHRPSHHRGSSLSEVSKEEIKAIEAKNAIREETEDDSSEATSDDDDDDEDDVPVTKSTSKSTVQATDQAEAEVMKDTKSQDQKTKDADAAGVSAAAAMFLSPNHDPNPNRLSADSASVYSFFDTAFSPAPLFSGTKALDLDLSFMQSDPRTSISTYSTNHFDVDPVNHLANGTASGEQTPRASEDIRPDEASTELQRGSPRRDILPSIPTIAPLRTPTKRQVSEPLLSSSTANRFSTPGSVPLPLNIRKTPKSTTAESPSTSTSNSPTKTPVRTPQPSRSQPQLQTLFQTQTHDQTLSPHQMKGPTRTQTQPELFSSSPSLSLSLSHTNTNATTSTSIATITNPTSPSTPHSTTTSTPTESRSLRFKKSLRSLRSKKSLPRMNQSSPSPTHEMPPNLPPQRQLKDMNVNMKANRAVSDGAYMKKERSSGMKNLLCF